MSFVVVMTYHVFIGERSARKHGALFYGAHGYEAVSTVAENEAMAAGAVKPYTPVLGRLFYLALLGYFGGFAFWSYENVYCSSLPSWMQLHALWHIMAGLGTFCAIQCQIAWRAEEMGARSTTLDASIGGHILPIVVARYEQ